MSARDLYLGIGGWDVARWRARFESLLPGRRVVTDDMSFDPAAVGFAALWKHRPGALSPMVNLRAVFSLGAGVDHLFRDTTLPAVPLARVVDPDLTFRMGEWVVLHVLRHHREHERYVAQQHGRIWDENEDQPAAKDVRVGMLGYGVLGQHAGGLLRAIGFDVAAWGRSPRAGADVPYFHGEAGLAAFLARTDILVCLLPLTPDTRGMLDHRLLRGLARNGRLGGPVLLNAGRGGLQVEADILRAFDDGTLLAATLDVFETEPLPPESALWSHPKVTVTPHNAAMSAPEAVCSLVVRQIGRVEAGLEPENRVDAKTGY